MTTEPLITTVLPTYRRPQLLRRAIMSVLNQSEPNIRVCVYDNASGDETAEVVQSIANHDSRVWYLQRPENIGLERNFNDGIRRVTTPYFSILSDDDVLLPDCYRTALDGFTRHPDAICSLTSVVRMMEDGQVLGAILDHWPREGYIQPGEEVARVARGQHPIITGMLFRREIIDAFGGFDMSIPAFDLDWEIRMAARYPFVVSKSVGAIFMFHAHATGVRAQSSYFWPSTVGILRNVQNDAHIDAATYQIIEHQLHQYMRALIFSVGLRSAIRADVADARYASAILELAYAAPLYARIIHRLADLFQAIPLAGRLARALYDRRHTIERWRNRTLQQRYGYLARYLHEGETR